MHKTGIQSLPSTKLSLQYLYSITTEHDTPNPGTI